MSRRWKLIRIKHIIRLAGLLGTLCFLNVCSQEARILTLDLEIAELVCEDGQRLFESRVLDLKGIRSVSANIHTHKAEIKFRDTDISEAQILNHLIDYGFSVNGQAGNPAARRRLPSCCFGETDVRKIQ